MKLIIFDCPQKKKFEPFVRKATQFYALQLFSKSMYQNLSILLKFKTNYEDYGSTIVSGYNKSGKPRKFLVEINKQIQAFEILRTLAHEMVHCKQFTYCETNPYLTKWKGNLLSEDIDYYSHPCEIEANGMEPGLYQKFCKEEKLWKVFEGIKAPNEKITSSGLGWKR
jgi:hypothetical protein